MFGRLVAGRGLRAATARGVVALAVGAVVLGVWGLWPAGAVADGCATPTVGISAASQLVDANNPTTQVTVVLTGAGFCPGQSLRVTDDLGVLLYSSTRYRASYTLNVTPPNNQTRTYTATVGANQASVSVTNQGWLGSVTLTADSTERDANNPTAILTATLDRALASPYRLSVYDDLGVRIATTTNLSGGVGYTLAVTPANGQSRVYTAFVAQDAPTSGEPSVDIRSQRDVEVTNAGWVGSLGIESDRPTVSAANPTAALTITVEHTIAGPYRLTLYDDQGFRYLNTTNQTTGTPTFVVYVNPPPSGTRTYTAYVAGDWPTSGAPSTDVRAIVSLKYVDGVLGGEVVEGVDLSWMASVLEGFSDEEIALALAGLPMPLRSTSTGPLADMWLTLRLTMSKKVALRTLLTRTAASGAVMGMLVITFAPPVGAPAPPTQPEALTPPSTVGLTAPMPIPMVFENSLTESLRLRAWTLSLAEARAAARHCLSWTRYAISQNALNPTTATGAHPCWGTTIHLPGGDTLEATNHYADAIEQNSAWIRLNWVNEVNRKPTLTRGWYQNAPWNCQGVLFVTDCDEYPFYASAQSGPGASLRIVASYPNKSAGSKWRWTGTKCGLQSGGGSLPLQAGDPVLVIPVRALGIPTRRVCR